MKMCSVIEKDSINSWDCIYSNNEHNTFFVNRVSFYWFHNGRSLKFKIRNEEFVDDMRVLFLDSNKDNYELAVVAEDEFIITRTSEEYGTVFMIFKRADKF